MLGAFQKKESGLEKKFAVSPARQSQFRSYQKINRSAMCGAMASWDFRRSRDAAVNARFRATSSSRSESSSIRPVRRKSTMRSMNGVPGVMTLYPYCTVQAWAQRGTVTLSLLYYPGLGTTRNCHPIPIEAKRKTERQGR